MFMMEITRLIERCRQGDAEALGELYKAYAQKMKGVCRRYISDEQDINDVLHDAFVIIFTSFDKLRDDKKAEAWMMSITRNVASKYKDHLMAKPFLPLKEAEQIPIPEDKAEVRGMPLEDVLRLIERLPEGYGHVLCLSVFEGLSHREIADMLGIEPHSSSSQLTRAKRMLRGMMQQYWAVLLLLLIPISMFLFRKEKPVTKVEKPVEAEQKQTQKEKQIEQPQAPVIVHSPVRYTTIVEPVIAQTVDSPDTLSNMIAKEQTALDTIKSKEQPDTAQIRHEIALPHYDITNLQREKSKKHNEWHLTLAYVGNSQSDISRTDNYMTMPEFSGSITRSTKLYNWGDYMDYVMANAPMMDSVSASNMRHVAIINSNHPKDPLTETKHHERPLTLQLSLSRQINSHWSLSTGLSYTRMKSTFESDNENTLIHRTQKLHYLGIPIKLNYRMAGGNRWSLYTSGGAQVDIPVSTRLTTQYIYGGPYAPIGNSPEIYATFNAPLQWSVGMGLGVQYQIVPHLNIYLEPSLNYFIPTSSDVETYRTEHPFDLSLPFGLRFTW